MLGNPVRPESHRQLYRLCTMRGFDFSGHDCTIPAGVMCFTPQASPRMQASWNQASGSA
jgi:hypothetical protein